MTFDKELYEILTGVEHALHELREGRTRAAELYLIHDVKNKLSELVWPSRDADALIAEYEDAKMRDEGMTADDMRAYPDWRL